MPENMASQYKEAAKLKKVNPSAIKQADKTFLGKGNILPPPNDRNVQLSAKNIKQC